MFRRKLLALDHYRAEDLDITKNDDFRSLVIWTEDQKIRHYKIDERGALRDLDNANWEDAFDKYWKDVGFPVDWKEMERSQVCDIDRVSSSNVRNPVKRSSTLSISLIIPSNRLYSVVNAFTRRLAGCGYVIGLRFAP